MEFRRLRADEIDVRIATVNEKGVSLLLYKDARCDMRILDETVGAENWQRSHELINGNLFCNVGIWCNRRNDGYGEWIWKQDVGTESYTEKEKGQASDSFKRACFNWGIGRELYTSPFIWVGADKVDIIYTNNKYTCKNKFYVSKINYDEDGKINLLIIKDKKTTDKLCFGYGMTNQGSQRNELDEYEKQSKAFAEANKNKNPKEAKEDFINQRLKELKDLLSIKNISDEDFLKGKYYKSFETMNIGQIESAIKQVSGL